MRTLAFTCALEALSAPTAWSLLQSRGGRELYAKSVAMNAVNNLLVGPAAYFLCESSFVSEPHGGARRCFSVVALLAAQSAGYYVAHVLMHTKRLYRSTHAFHHRYDAVVVPMAANAVTVYEYAMAYLLPIVLGVALSAPDAFSLQAAVYIVSAANVVIHSPLVQSWTRDAYPACLVSAADHCVHHRQRGPPYAAPILNLDRLRGSSPE